MTCAAEFSALLCPSTSSNSKLLGTSNLASPECSPKHSSVASRVGSMGENRGDINAEWEFDRRENQKLIKLSLDFSEAHTQPKSKSISFTYGSGNLMKFGITNLKKNNLAQAGKQVNNNLSVSQLYSIIKRHVLALSRASLQISSNHRAAYRSGPKSRRSRKRYIRGKSRSLSISSFRNLSLSEVRRSK